MKRTTPLLFALLLGSGAMAVAAQPKAEAARKLCGWFDNPTPGNAWLTDREDEWTVGMQGGHQAEGEWPTFTPKQWVRSGGSHGHGCACLVVIADPRTHEIKRIVSSHGRPLSACRNDPSLPKRPA